MNNHRDRLTVLGSRPSLGWRVLLVLAFITVASATHAAEPSRFNAGQLEEMCKSEANLDYGYCAGYVTAVADEMMFGSIGEYRACNHAAVKSQQYVDLFKTYVESHPEAMSMSADLAAAAAFARAFPCNP